MPAPLVVTLCGLWPRACATRRGTRAFSASQRHDIPCQTCSCLNAMDMAAEQEKPKPSISQESQWHAMELNAH
jgi:hypothetical protein